MEKTLIIGSGISGLLAARILQQNSIPYIGLERESSLAANREAGQKRLHTEEAVEFLKKFVPIVDWIRMDEMPMERKKGQWTPLKTEELEGTEKIYFKDSFFYAKVSFSELVEKIAEPIKENFLLEKNVVEIRASEKKVLCQDGSEYPYETLLWCADLSSLLRICKQGKSSLKTTKKLEEARGLINLFWESSEPLIQNKNSVSFSFRYKDYKLKTIGLTDPLDGEESQHVHWVLPIEKELAEDREEIAKCVRTLKRELFKEFPDSQTKIKKEKIIFMPSIADAIHLPAKDLQVFEGITYIGPNLAVPVDTETKEEISGLDLTIHNCKKFEATLPSH